MTVTVSWISWVVYFVGGTFLHLASLNCSSSSRFVLYCRMTLYLIGSLVCNNSILYHCFNFLYHIIAKCVQMLTSEKIFVIVSVKMKTAWKQFHRSCEKTTLFLCPNILFVWDNHIILTWKIYNFYMVWLQ